MAAGTFLQNNLDEFWAMANFASPGELGELASFRAQVTLPIEAARQPAATAEEKAAGEEAAARLQRATERFVLRRDGSVLASMLPPRTESVRPVREAAGADVTTTFLIWQVLFARLSKQQAADYAHTLALAKAEGGAPAQPLAALAHLRGICSHGDLGDESTRKVPGKYPADLGKIAEHTNAGATAAAAASAAAPAAEVAKLEALMRLLPAVHAAGEKVVLCAGFTRSLDLLQLSIEARGWGTLRLDGKVGVEKRQELVDRFNAPGSPVFAFLLSTRAGGTGFNLVGANRLVLYDPDWNPAVDDQAMARVYRDGQKKPVYVWRMLSAGTVEEKMYQRQLFKKQLGGIVEQGAEHTEPGGGGGGLVGGSFSTEELLQLFEYEPATRCDTLAILLNKAGAAGGERSADEAGSLLEELELSDPLLARAAQQGGETTARLTHICDALSLEGLAVCHDTASHAELGGEEEEAVEAEEEEAQDETNDGGCAGGYAGGCNSPSLLLSSDDEGAPRMKPVAFKRQRTVKVDDSSGEE